MLIERIAYLHNVFYLFLAMLVCHRICSALSGLLVLHEKQTKCTIDAYASELRHQVNNSHDSCWLRFGVSGCAEIHIAARVGAQIPRHHEETSPPRLAEATRALTQPAW